ncbi:MAG TPA: sigma factor-like helix-turn-helix DNA-binding protein, partial [Candidatus Limnocylindrales bacterium]|nr:sigma factor-like helix-turn-helix DNA-binding protein [Candidatus Limnocylindrales bacterium]
GAVADRDELARVFGRLSIEHRTIVVLHHYLGLTVDEAATTIGIPVGTAKSRLHYATEALRAALDADARRTSAGRALA